MIDLVGHLPPITLDQPNYDDQAHDEDQQNMADRTIDEYNTIKQYTQRSPPGSTINSF